MFNSNLLTQKEMTEPLNKYEFFEEIVCREMSRDIIPSILVKDINDFISDSGKMDLLYNLLMKLRSEKRKVLIFTQMTKMLDLLERLLASKGFTYVRLDGSIAAEKRQVIVQSFNKNPKIMVFISSTRVGGIGINLTSADTVIFYDNDWNPAVDKQAQDRCHRIGQIRNVTVYKMVTKHTIEENILSTSNLKAKMDHLVLNKGKFNLLRLFQMSNKVNDGQTADLPEEPKNDVFQENTSNKFIKYLNLVEDEEDELPADIMEQQNEESDDSDSQQNDDENSQDFSDIEDGMTNNFHNKIVDNMIPDVWKYGVNYIESLLKRKFGDLEEYKREEAAGSEVCLKRVKENVESSFMPENAQSNIERQEEHFKKILSRISFDLSARESDILIEKMRNKLQGSSEVN
jgi:superfamily II DNA/RNA helicase